MEVEFVKRYALFHLNIIGLNPFTEGFLRYIRFSVYLAFILSLSLQIAIDFYIHFDSTAGIDDTIILFPPAEQVIFKTICTMYFQKDIIDLIKKTGDFWKTDDDDNELIELLRVKNTYFLKIFNKYRNMLVVTIIGFLVNIAVFGYGILENHLGIQDYLKMIVDQMYIVLLGYGMVSYDSMFFTLVNCGVIQMTKIQYGLENLSMKKTSNEIYKEFSSLVKYHSDILRFITDINNIFSVQLLNHFSTTICCICMGIFMLNIDGFPPSMEKVLYFSSYLACHHYQLFIYCMYGQELLNEMELVGQALYNSKWYVRHQPKLTKAMPYTMVMSSLPNKLTIGGYWELNLRTFMMVVKTSFSFNTFMQSVYTKQQDHLSS